MGSLCIVLTQPFQSKSTIVLAPFFSIRTTDRVPSSTNPSNYKSCVFESQSNRKFNIASFQLSAKKKSKFISDDLLAQIEASEASEGEVENVTSVAVEDVKPTTINDKKSKSSNNNKNKVVSDDSWKLALEEEEDKQEDKTAAVSNSQADKKNKKNKKNKNKGSSVDKSQEADVEESEDEGEDFDFFLGKHKAKDEESTSAHVITNVEEAKVASVSEAEVSRKSKPSARVRLQESSQPDFVMMGLDRVSVFFGDDIILKNATFSVTTGERIGLVGPNGGGKSTSLKVLAEELTPNDGEVIKSSGNLRVAFLRQEFIDNLVLNRTLKDELLSSFTEEQEILRKIAECEKDIADATDDDSRMDQAIDKLQTLQEDALRKGVYALDSKIKRVMDSMGFTPEDGDAPVSSFSGGWKMRIGLAKILASDPNILLLDEPTNHMDLDSVIWLESFLKTQTLPMIIVSHDREFLDQVCNKIVDIENGVTVPYDGNYSRFLELRKARLTTWREQYEKQTKYVKEEEKWIKKSISDPALAMQVKARQDSLEKYKNSPDFLSPPPRDRRFRFRFPPAPRSAETMLEVTKLSKGFGEGKYKVLFENANFVVNRGNRIGFIGPNGSGKSTMLKLIMGIEDPNAGYCELTSSNVIPNYYAQNQADALDLDLTVVEALQEVAPSDVTLTDLRNLLGQFMFKGEDVEKKIRYLSGGEKARVALCRMMLTPANLLLLDEPTNHLDIVSKEVLEDALVNFHGAVLVVSHDRYFLSQVANAIFEFGNKAVVRYDCDYHDYMDLQNGETGLKEKVVSRFVQGNEYKITKCRETEELPPDEKSLRKKNFGGSGVTSGNLFKGIKNAKRFAPGNL